MNSKKQAFRQEARRRLASLGAKEFEAKSIELSCQLGPLIQKCPKDILGAFSPLKDEPRWHAEMKDSKKLNTAYPKIIGPGKMKFLQCKPEELIAENKFGVQIMSPPDKRPVVCPKALLIPALALTPKGDRIGRGGGYYDRFLATFKGLRIGICFEEQLYDGIPTEYHDQRVQMIVTDKQVIRC